MKTKKKLNPALKALKALVGEWETELSNASFLPDNTAKLKGRVTIEWIENGGFIVIRQGDIPLPWSRWLIGRDDSEPNYSVFYFDDRGVSRKYEMSFTKGIWKMWRNSPKFSQRFEGKLSKNGSIIKAHWEKSMDGKNWEHDFNLTYSKLKK
jgi:hypothetical protein